MWGGGGGGGGQSSVTPQTPRSSRMERVRSQLRQQRLERMQGSGPTHGSGSRPGVQQYIPPELRCESALGESESVRASERQETPASETQSSVQKV